MKWSWKVARINGIDVSIHATFLLLLLVIGLSFWQSSHSLVAVVRGLSLILILFACVVMHEFGHALTARRFGIKTRSITLLPIGGVAAMESMPEDPRQEMLVAVAGPAVNLGLAALLWLCLALSPVDPGADSLPTADGSFWRQVMVINLVLAVFNLLPAFPMDGGRVLRAMLALTMTREEATQRAVAIGQSLAAAMFAVGFLYNPMLMLVAVFVWFGGAAEANAEILHSVLLKATAGHSMITRFETLQVGDRLQRAVDLTLSGNQRHFPVFTAAGPLRLLTQTDMLLALREEGENVVVGGLPLKPMSCIDASESLSSILNRLQELQAPLVGVMERDQLVGVIDLENVIELINIDQAIKAHQQAQGGRLM